MGKNAADKLESYMEAVEADLLDSVHSPRVRAELEDTLRQLWARDDGRAYLALRGYLRYAAAHTTGTVEENWALDDNEAEKYQNSKYFQGTVQPLLNQINAKFQQLNATYNRDAKKNYRLQTNITPRSLKEQLHNWLGSDGNGVKIIIRDSRSLKHKLLTEIAKPKYADDPTADHGLAEFEKFLQKTDLPEEPTFATPGLSAHGTGRAFDFVVVPDVVGTSATKESREKWQKDKWADQLHAAIRAVDPDGKKFKGPLGSKELPGPDEPWHYFYVPVPPPESYK